MKTARIFNGSWFLFAVAVATLALAACVANVFEYHQTVRLLNGARAGVVPTAASRSFPAELAGLAHCAAAKWALLCAAATVAGVGLLELGYSELWSGLLPHLAGYLVVASGTVGIFAMTRSRSGARRRLPWLRPAQAGLTVALVVLIGLFLFQPPREASSRPDIETQTRALTGPVR